MIIQTDAANKDRLIQALSNHPLFERSRVEDANQTTQSALDRLDLINVFLAIVGVFAVAIFVLSLYFSWKQRYSPLLLYQETLYQL